MGLFDFVAEAGEKLTEKVLGSTNDEDINRPVEISPERLNQLRQENISRMLGQLDIEGEQVTVTVNGALATLTGFAPSQEALEKMVLCAGNQHGISQVNCQLQVEAPEGASGEAADAGETGASTFYTVQPGDTLSGIAQQHYGSAGKYRVIFEANQPLLADPDRIYPGQSLRIPRLQA